MSKILFSSQRGNFWYVIRKNRRAKHLGLSVYCDGRVVVTVPYSANTKNVLSFVLEKSKWVQKKLHYYSGFENVSLAQLKRSDYIKHKEEARILIYKQLDTFSKIYGFSYNKVSIRNQKTCWGSCTEKGNLNFNYKILFLAEELGNYIIVHELCHLKEMNHSPKFWELVAQEVPNHKDIRKQLRKIL